VVETPDELANVLMQIDALNDTNIVVHVKLPQTDVPHAIAYKFAGTGEDGHESPSFPPYCPPGTVQ
jgi:hypothetical protein